MQKFQLNEIFWTFQGEGFNAGRRALFVRMPHCNLNCSWCDTEYDTKTEVEDKEMAVLALSEKARFAVLTGGEPMQNKESPEVLKHLHKMGFTVATETNGTFPAIEGIDWVTCSPKAEAKYKVNRLLWPKVDEFKYVVDKDFDFAILDRHNLNDKNYKIGQKLGVQLYLSPEFNDMKNNLSKIYSYIKDHPHWKISLQTHKWMDIK